MNNSNTTRSNTTRSNTTRSNTTEPAPTDSNLFAYYTRLDSGADWEDRAFVGEYADVVVNVAQGERFVFWRASSYLPHWDTGEPTYVTQLFETAGDGDDLRWDALNRHSHVRIIAQSESEIVVHWRYAPVFDTGESPMLPGWNGWADEYYTVRHDKTVLREVYDHEDRIKHTIQLSLKSDGSIVEDTRESAPFSPTAPAFNSDRALPTGDDSGFGASYTKLGYSGAWDTGPDDDYAPLSDDWNATWQVMDHPDVVVNFDGSTTKWVFWRGLGFVPSLVSENGAWFSNEFNETWDWPEMCEEGGAEPMNDKQARFSHVRVIENTPARVVVHWRYHPTGICYNLIDVEDSPDGWGATSEFIFFIYPDGSTLSKNTVYSRQATVKDAFEFHEAMIMHGPGTRPADNIEIFDTVTVINMDGAVEVLDGEDGGINAIGDDPIIPDAAPNITRINLTHTDFDTYTIMEHGGTLEIRPYFEQGFEEAYPGYHFVSWDHWPVNLIRAFGRGTEASAYPSHTSLFHMMHNPNHSTTDTSATRLLLTGLSTITDAEVTTLAKSWLNAPQIANVTGATAFVYDETQRAYHLTTASNTLAFTLDGSQTNPIVNPAFVLNGWSSTTPVTVKVDGETIESVKQGLTRNTNGQPTLILFVPLNAERATRFEIN